MTNLFEIASRLAFRYATGKGDLTTEDLWKLPLTSPKGISLDSVAISTNRDLQECQTTSFVTSTKGSIDKQRIEQKLEIIKFIIAYRLNEKQQIKDSLAASERKQSILAALNEKKDQALKSMSEEELRKELEKFN